MAASPSASLLQRPLFGGAIGALLPQNAIDASDLRQVPDTQEVFVFPDSDLSVIVEILQKVTEDDTPEKLREGARFHFESLAHDNEATWHEIDDTYRPSTVPDAGPASTQTPRPSLLRGRQRVAKFRKSDSEADDVLIWLAVIRVEDKGVDLVLTANLPLPKEGGDGDPWEREQPQAVERMFECIASSLKIVDYGLFV